MKTETQNNQILKHLKNHKNGITPKTAYERYGIMRLSGRIYELRQKGYTITRDDVTEKNRYGHTVTFARYRLVEE